MKTVGNGTESATFFLDSSCSLLKLLTYISIHEMVVMEAGRAGWWPVAIKSQVDKGLNSTDGYIDT